MALSLGSPRAEVIRRLFTVEPGLSSTGAKARRDRPAVWRGSRCAARRMRSTSDAIRTQRPYVAPMSDPAVRSAPHESEEQRARRLAWERERLAEAEKDIAAGRVISGGAALDWLDRWAAGEDLDEPDLH